MSIESRKDLILALALCALGLVVVWDINSVEQVLIAGNEQVNYKSLPTIYGWGLAILAAIMAIGTLLKRGEDDPSSAGAPAADESVVAFDDNVTEDIGDENHESDSGVNPITPTGALIRVGATVVTLFGFTVGLEQLPFSLATGLFLFVMFYIFNQKNLIRNAIVAAIGAFLFDILFRQILNLPF